VEERRTPISRGFKKKKKKAGTPACPRLQSEHRLWEKPKKEEKRNAPATLMP